MTHAYQITVLPLELPSRFVSRLCCWHDTRLPSSLPPARSCACASHYRTQHSSCMQKAPPATRSKLGVNVLPRAHSFGVGRADADAAALSRHLSRHQMRSGHMRAGNDLFAAPAPRNEKSANSPQVLLLHQQPSSMSIATAQQQLHRSTPPQTTAIPERGSEPEQSHCPAPATPTPGDLAAADAFRALEEIERLRIARQRSDDEWRWFNTPMQARALGRTGFGMGQMKSSASLPALGSVGAAPPQGSVRLPAVLGWNFWTYGSETRPLFAHGELSPHVQGPRLYG